MSRFGEKKRKKKRREKKESHSNKSKGVKHAAVPTILEWEKQKFNDLGDLDDSQKKNCPRWKKGKGPELAFREERNLSRLSRPLSKT